MQNKVGNNIVTLSLFVQVCTPTFTNKNSALQFYSKSIKDTEHCFNL